MFFTKAGGIVAWIATVLGFFMLISGYEINVNETASIFADVLRLETSQKANIQADVFMDQGIIALLCGLALGILTEISRSVSRQKEE